MLLAKEAAAFCVVASAGNETVTESLQSEVSGLSGHPASESDLILISTLSPFVIGMSSWLMLFASASAVNSGAQTYVPELGS